MRLGVQPLKWSGRLQRVLLSQVQSGISRRVIINDAVVAYLDVLGFAEKTSEREVEMTLADFSGPLASASGMYPRVRMNIFSDDAFLAIDSERADELLGAIRYAFERWVGDGIMVRGGIARGRYIESDSMTFQKASGNFSGSLFFGEGIIRAVRSQRGAGVLLFTNKGCASFFARKYKEPIFQLDNYLFLGWSDKDNILRRFAGISAFRLLRRISTGANENDQIVQKMKNNILYVRAQHKSQQREILLILLTILTSSGLEARLRTKAMSLLGLSNLAKANKWQKQARKLATAGNWLEEWSAIADSDSSL